MKHIILLVAALALAACLAACREPVTEAEARAAYESLGRMYRSNDLEGLRSQFLPQAVIVMIDQGERTEFTIDEYIDAHRTGMDLIRDYSIESQVDTVAIEPGRAIVVGTVRESGVMLGKPVATRTLETVTFVRRGGGLRIESISGEVSLEKGVE